MECVDRAFNSTCSRGTIMRWFRQWFRGDDVRKQDGYAHLELEELEARNVLSSALLDGSPIAAPLLLSAHSRNLSSAPVAGSGMTSVVNITALSDQTNTEGDKVCFRVTVTGVSNQQVVFSADELPTGLSIAPQSGLISGTIAPGAALDGPYSTTVTATAGAFTQSQAFDWYVSSSVAIAQINDQQNTEGDKVTLQVTATDQNPLPLTFSADGLPGGLRINPKTGLITGTILAGAANNGPCDTTITASDGISLSSQAFNWNLASFVTMTQLPDQLDTEGDSVSLQATATDQRPLSLTFSADGLPDGLTINPKTGLITGTILAGAANDVPCYTPIITASDGTSTASMSFNWNVTSLVTMTQTPEQQNSEGDSVSLQVIATDGNHLPLTFSADWLPFGLSINPTTGLISGTILAGAANGGSCNPNITASDGVSTNSEIFAWDVASAVTVNPIQNQSSTEGDTISLQVTATDRNHLPFTFRAYGLPGGLSINPTTGLISGTITAGGAEDGFLSTTVTAFDGISSSSRQFDWSVASRVTLTSWPDGQNTEGDRISFQVTATDLVNLPLSFSALGLPNGLTINPNTGLITGTILAGAANNGTCYTTITATDGVSSDSQSFSWDLASLVTVTQSPDQQNAEGDTVSIRETATDQNDLPLTFSASGLPNGLTIDPKTGLITGTISAGAANDGPLATTITASDGTSMASESFTWNVDSFVTVTQLPDQLNNEGDGVSLQVTATDQNQLPFTFSAVGLPDGLTINPKTGLITGTISAGAANDGPCYPTITASDGTSQASMFFTWNLQSFVTVMQIPDQQITEGDTVSLQATATDSKGLSLTFSADDLPNGLHLNPTTGLITGTILAGAANGGAYSTTITASDGSSASSQSFYWYMTSFVSIPAVPSQQNTEGDRVSLQVTATDQRQLPLTFSADDLPDGLTINPTTGLITGTILAGAAVDRPFSDVTIMASDGASTATQYFDWYLGSSVTVAPLPTSLDNTEGDTVSLQVVATDLNNLPLTFKASGLPSGLSINPKTGLITGTIQAGAGNNGYYYAWITASDGISIGSQAFEWYVSSYVAVTPVPDQQSAEGASVSLQVTATDPNDLPLTFSAYGLPSGLIINAKTGLITGTIFGGAANDGSCLPTIIASDGTSSASQSFNWNVASFVTGTPLSDQQNSEGDSVALQATATDQNHLPLTFSAVGLPFGLNINPKTGWITGTISAGAEYDGPFSPTITASDGVSSNSWSFNWNVASTIWVMPLPDLQNTEGNTVSLRISATDPRQLPLVFSADSLPDGLTINPTTGLISGTILAGAANDGPCSVTITVSDGITSASQSFNWNLESPVTVSPLPDQQNTEGDRVSLQVTATDRNHLPLTYSADELPDGLRIDPNSGRITGTILAGAANDGTLYTTITASDGVSSASHSFIWNLTSFVTVTPLLDQQNTEGDTVSLQVTATDLNPLPLTFSAYELPDGLSINPSTGLISGTILAGAANGGSDSTTIMASDGASMGSLTINWNLVSVVSVTPLPDQENTEGDTVTLQATARDMNHLPLTFGADDLPNGLSINPNTGLITGTIFAGAANYGPFTATITASDGTSTSSQTFTWSVSSPVSSVFGSSPPGSISFDSPTPPSIFGALPASSAASSGTLSPQGVVALDTPASTSAAGDASSTVATLAPSGSSSMVLAPTSQITASLYQRATIPSSIPGFGAGPAIQQPVSAPPNAVAQAIVSSVNGTIVVPTNLLGKPAASVNSTDPGSSSSTDPSSTVNDNDPFDPVSDPLAKIDPAI